MAPSGPRGDTRNTRSATRGNGSKAGGGGIRKSGGPKLDRNGDVIMGNDPVAKTTTGGGGGGRGGGARGGRGGGRAATSTEQRIRRHLGASGEASLEKRISELPRKQRNSQAGRKTFTVRGLAESKAASNADRGEKSILEFIERKTINMGGSGGSGIRVLKSLLESPNVLLVMVSKDDAVELQKLNGFVFAGAKLTVEEKSDGWPGQNDHNNNNNNSGSGSNNNNNTNKPKLSQETLERKAQLQQVLGVRYDGPRQLLDLSALGEDPVLIGMGYLQDKERAEKTFKVLMTICDEIFPTADAKQKAVTSVSLANNNIDWVGQVYVLAETFPDIRHLDLSGNAFRQLKSLNRWRGRFRNLETLLLTGNPVETEDANYRTELMQWFPRLMNLSNTQVRTPEQVAAEEAARLAARPTPIPQFGSDFRDGSGISEAFLTQFIQLYDTDRAQAAALFYDEDSQFSLSVVSNAVRDPWNGQGPAPTPVLPWAAYLRYSRNLTRIVSRSARVQRLVRGGAMIQALWATLPQTRHPALATELHKYILDCHPLPGIPEPATAGQQTTTGVDGLLLTLHGEFEEIEASSGRTGKRSFTRTFVLGPAAAGRPAAFRVVSDMLSLRAHQALPGQTAAAPAAAAPMVPAVQAVQAVQAVPTAVAPPAAPASEQEQKAAMVAELSKVTNMTAQYSEMCLVTAGWNYEAAIAKFQELRPSLGPEVFNS